MVKAVRKMRPLFSFRAGEMAILDPQVQFCYIKTVLNFLFIFSPRPEPDFCRLSARRFGVNGLRFL
jgi:hypothetical protein